MAAMMVERTAPGTFRALPAPLATLALGVVYGLSARSVAGRGGVGRNTGRYGGRLPEGRTGPSPRRSAGCFCSSSGRPSGGVWLPCPAAGVPAMAGPMPATPG